MSNRADSIAVVSTNSPVLPSLSALGVPSALHLFPSCETQKAEYHTLLRPINHRPQEHLPIHLDESYARRHAQRSDYMVERRSWSYRRIGVPWHHQPDKDPAIRIPAVVCGAMWRITLQMSWSAHGVISRRIWPVFGVGCWMRAWAFCAASYVCLRVSSSAGETSMASCPRISTCRSSGRDTGRAMGLYWRIWLCVSWAARSLCIRC